MQSTAKTKYATLERNTSHGVIFSTTRMDETSEKSMISAPNISQAPIGRSQRYSATCDCPARNIPRNTLITAHSADVNASRIGCFGTAAARVTAPSGRNNAVRQK